MPDEIRDKCLKIIAGSCELDVKELYQKYAKEPLEMDSLIWFYNWRRNSKSNIMTLKNLHFI